MQYGLPIIVIMLACVLFVGGLAGKRGRSNLIWYVLGVNALAAEKYEVFARLLTTKITVDRSESTMASSLHSGLLPNPDVWQKLPGLEGHFTPFSTHVLSILDELVPDSSPVASDREKLFCRFEYFVALSIVQEELGRNDGQPWVPIGRFGWRRRSTQYHDVITAVQEEADASSGNWKPIQAGLFGGSMPRFT